MKNAQRVVVDAEGVNRIGNRTCSELLPISVKDLFSGRRDKAPWEPNATPDPHAAKWKELLTPGIDLLAKAGIREYAAGGAGTA